MSSHLSINLKSLILLNIGFVALNMSDKRVKRRANNARVVDDGENVQLLPVLNIQVGNEDVVDDHEEQDRDADDAMGDGEVDVVMDRVKSVTKGDFSEKLNVFQFGVQVVTCLAASLAGFFMSAMDKMVNGVPEFSAGYAVVMLLSMSTATMGIAAFKAEILKNFHGCSFVNTIIPGQWTLVSPIAFEDVGKYPIGSCFMKNGKYFTFVKLLDFVSSKFRLANTLFVENVISASNEELKSRAVSVPTADMTGKYVLPLGKSEAYTTDLAAVLSEDKTPIVVIDGVLDMTLSEFSVATANLEPVNWLFNFVYLVNFKIAASSTTIALATLMDVLSKSVSFEAGTTRMRAMCAMNFGERANHIVSLRGNEVGKMMGDYNERILNLLDKFDWRAYSTSDVATYAIEAQYRSSVFVEKFLPKVGHGEICLRSGSTTDNIKTVYVDQVSFNEIDRIENPVDKSFVCLPNTHSLNDFNGRNRKQRKNVGAKGKNNQPMADEEAVGSMMVYVVNTADVVGGYADGWRSSLKSTEGKQGNKFKPTRNLVFLEVVDVVTLKHRIDKGSAVESVKLPKKVDETSKMFEDVEFI